MPRKESHRTRLQVSALLLYAANLVVCQDSHAQTLRVTVNYKTWEDVVFNTNQGQQDLLPTFYINARPRQGQPDEQQLNRSGQAAFNLDAKDVYSLSWRTVENRGFVLWPYRDLGPLSTNYTKFRLKRFDDVSVETRLQATEMIERGDFKGAEEDFENLKQMYRILPSALNGRDRRREFETTFLRSLCDAALTYRNTHRIHKRVDDEDGLDRADLEADWIWELVWDSVREEAQPDLGQLAQALLLWEAFARDVFLRDRHDWPSKHGRKTPAFRNDIYRQRVIAQIEAIQNVLNHEAIARPIIRELEGIASKRIRAQQLKLWRSGVLNISAAKVDFEQLSALIHGMYKYCRSRGARE